MSTRNDKDPLSTAVPAAEREALTKERHQKPLQHDQGGEFDYGVEGGQSQQFGEDATAGKGEGPQSSAPAEAGTRRTPAEPSTVSTSSADSSSADPDARHRPLDAPVGQVTRHV